MSSELVASLDGLYLRSHLIITLRSDFKIPFFSNSPMRCRSWALYSSEDESLEEDFDAAPEAAYAAEESLVLECFIFG